MTAVVATRWLDDDEMRAWLAFVGVGPRLYAQLDRDLEDAHGLTRGDYGILAELSAAPDGRMRMSELAIAAYESKSGLSHHVGRLERDGLVRRDACPTDRRGLFATLTAKGRRVLERAAPDHVASVRAHFFDHLTPTQVRALADALTPIADHLRGMQEEGVG